MSLLFGRTIAAVKTTPDNYFFLTPTAVLRRWLRGRRIESVHGRRVDDAGAAARGFQPDAHTTCT